MNSIANEKGQARRRPALRIAKQPDTPTPGERNRLRELHIERGEERQLASDMNLLAAVRLGAALQRHKEK